MAAAVTTYKEQGNTAFKTGRYREAEQLYTAALDACDDAAADRHLLHGNRCCDAVACMRHAEAAQP